MPQSIVIIYQQSQMILTKTNERVALKNLPSLLKGETPVIFIHYETKKDMTLMALFRYFAQYGSQYEFTETEKRILYKLLTKKAAEHGESNRKRVGESGILQEKV